MKAQHTLIDKAILQLDSALRTLFVTEPSSSRPYPANHLKDCTLSEAEMKDVAGMMRVNHAGEVCAQALYQGQAFTAGTSAVREAMQHAAEEEQDHLIWCQKRLTELKSHTSYFNPVWYWGSLCIGAASGWMGDGWSLGFVVETERQVIIHLKSHLAKLPPHDHVSRKIIEQMMVDEEQHQTQALQSGAYSLPAPVRFIMRYTAKIMTKTAYYI